MRLSTEYDAVMAKSSDKPKKLLEAPRNDLRVSRRCRLVDRLPCRLHALFDPALGEEIQPDALSLDPPFRAGVASRPGLQAASRPGSGRLDGPPARPAQPARVLTARSSAP